jgi:hypothetical protein
LRDRVRLSLEPDSVVVRPGDRPVPTPGAGHGKHRAPEGEDGA